jgi:hypothetical protein
MLVCLMSPAIDPQAHKPYTIEKGRFSRDLLGIGAANRIYSHATLEPDPLVRE